MYALTVTGGKALGQGGGIYFDGSDLRLDHVAVVGNTATPADPAATFSHSQGGGNGSTITELGRNVTIRSDGCFTASGDITGDPLLGPLADNGGQTDTQALLPGSPAIDKADIAQCPATDQRDLPRPALGGCDIGTFRQLRSHDGRQPRASRARN
jgi:hypothetical protein